MSQSAEIRQYQNESALMPAVVFAILCALSLAIWHGPLLQTLSLALSDERYTHILLVLPVSLTLIFRQRIMAPRKTHPNFWGGVCLVLVLTLEMAIWWVKPGVASDMQLALSMAAMIVFWMGAFLLCFGVQAFRPLTFPFLFLFWMVPPPASLLARAIEWLQHGSATAAQMLFLTSGTPVTRDEILLHLPGFTLQVAPECSSIRSSLMLIVITMVLAQLLLVSPWRKALVVSLSLPLCIAKNGLRICTLGMLALHVDRSYLTGSLHHHGGVIFFAAALALIFLLLAVLRHAELAAGRSVFAKRTVPVGEQKGVTAL